MKQGKENICGHNLHILGVTFSASVFHLTVFVWGTSLVVWWLRLHLPMKGVQVQSLVGELKSHMPHDQKHKKEREREKQYCNKFNRCFKKLSIK